MSYVIEKKSKTSETGCTSSNYERTMTTPRKLSCSPVFPNSLPDDCDNIDVVWDWYSPTSKPRFHKQRVKVQQSPRLLVKRHPSNDQISVFNKLQEDLKTVANTTVTNSNKTNEKVKPSSEVLNNLERRDYLDIFNDSLDEELIIISQKVEDSVLQNQCDNKTGLSVQVKINDKLEREKFCTTAIGNDSFDGMFAAITDEDLNLGHKGNLDKQLIPTPKVESPIKCSPEEIEQKRLQALERRKAKKLQDTIERNRQEALKRLALSKKRRVLQK